MKLNSRLKVSMPAEGDSLIAVCLVRIVHQIKIRHPEKELRNRDLEQFFTLGLPQHNDAAQAKHDDEPMSDMMRARALELCPVDYVTYAWVWSSYCRSLGIGSASDNNDKKGDRHVPSCKHYSGRCDAGRCRQCGSDSSCLSARFGGHRYRRLGIRGIPRIPRILWWRLLRPL
jgi:hypothetical protein